MRYLTYALVFGASLGFIAPLHADVTIKTNGPDVSVNKNGAVAIQQSTYTATATPTPTVVSAPPGQTLTPLGQWSSLSGHVTQVDQQARTITMTINGTNTVVLIPDDPAHTVYYKNGNQQSHLNDLHAGDDVTVRRI